MGPIQSQKIKPEHLARRAIVYLRQSTMRQVKENVESQRLQYALEDRVRTLGWKNVELIDVDLGFSASVGAEKRLGFDSLIGSVARQEVGIVIGREVSRLSRTDTDFCRLLEVCQIFDTLIGDDDRVYDLNSIDDQLVLGIKATMSVTELSVLKKRLLAGKEEKARRGELIICLPVGYVLDGAGDVVMDPDERIRQAVSSIFRKYRELWSVRQTLQWFHNSEAQLPVHKAAAGKVKLVWQLPTREYLYNLLTNPYYAGAYTYGRRRTQTVFEDGRLVKKCARPARWPEEFKVFIPDHHSGYTDWRTYEEIQKMLSRNNTKSGPSSAPAAVRKGQALLAGLLRCSECSRKLVVSYRSRTGTYSCRGNYPQGGGRCIGLGCQRVDRRVSEEVLSVISPLGIDASLRAIEALRSSGDEECRRLALELQQLDYEVQRAYEQYDEVDPRHRLVAAELERRWNVKLEERERLSETIAASEAAKQPLGPGEAEKIRALGKDFARVWEKCPVELKKKILHTVIETIIVELDGKVILLFLHWKGGSHTQIELKRRKSSGNRTSEEAMEVIRKMAEAGYGDDEIAGVMNRLELRTGHNNRWNQGRVLSARYKYSIPGQQRRRPDPDILNLRQAAHHCGVATSAIRRMAEDGILSMKQVVECAPWELWRSDLDSEPVRSFLEYLQKTGRYPQRGGCSEEQQDLFT